METKILKFTPKKPVNASCQSVSQSLSERGVTSPSHLASFEELQMLRVWSKVIEQSRKFAEHNYNDELGQFLGMVG